jgi:FtsP/CotA-like multicopper oxidase with cupredoxin domain
MVVNGVTWPQLEVAPARYRFRLLDGCDSRALNLALVYQNGSREDTHDSDFPTNATMKELPFVQIGAEQGFLPRPAEIRTGFATPILNARKPSPQERVPASNPQQALLMMPAERADVIVDFRGLAEGTIVTMINTAPDSPFGGFPDVPADPATTGQVMRFVVNNRLLNVRDAMTTDPYSLLPVAEGNQGPATRTRQVSLNELESEELCVDVDGEGNVAPIAGSSPETGCLLGGAPFGPEEALLGLLDGATGAGIPLHWTDTSGVSTPVPVTLQSGVTMMVNVTENPSRGDIENWEIYNFTEDGHPIHLHMVRFQVVGRRPIPGFEPVNPIIQPWEAGYKDTVLAYPGEITTVRATFDIAGLYVWHCHIIEHEDNEMMRPYVVSPERR